MLSGRSRTEFLSYGSPLQNARFLVGLTQAELAEKVGASRQTISSLERGASIPSVSLALALAAALGATVEELFRVDPVRA